MLEALHLTKRYASLPAAQDVCFTLRPGQVLGCLGPNGSGKSTTVKMLTSLLEPTRGEVLANGQNIRDEKPSSESTQPLHRKSRRQSIGQSLVGGDQI